MIRGRESNLRLEKETLMSDSNLVPGILTPPPVVQVVRLGAADRVVKPLERQDMHSTLATILERNGETPEPVSPVVETAFQSSNRRMLQIKAICDQAAHTDVPILLLGESGVGKEVIARYIHARSGRRDSFVKVNCAALPMDLLESELFGHERGAFTGAQRDKPGKFELAGRGTLMLDEVGEMHPLLQAKLLHVLQDGEYSRLGATHTRTSEARIVAATNRRLDTLVQTGGFREDLFFRLNVITIEIPPLRQRPEDIASLCHSFVERYRIKYNSRVKQLPGELVARFEAFHWPGNIRQLENAVKRFLIFPDLQQAMAELEDKPAAPVPMRRSSCSTVSPKSVSLKEVAANAAEEAERELIFQTLSEVNWNRKQAARRLGICYKSLLNKLHRWQLQDKSTENGHANEQTKAAHGGRS
jgi:two-component system response regulator AtoC